MFCQAELSVSVYFAEQPIPVKTLEHVKKEWGGEESQTKQKGENICPQVGQRSTWVT